MARMAVILSGCGVFDGSEIHESVLLLLCLAQQGHSYHCFAPDKPQVVVINHLTQKSDKESRNCLVEAARIARGDISPLARLSHVGYDALMMPGGFGAAINLSSFGKDKENCTVDADFKKAVLEFHKAGKPIGATCITPAALAKIFEGVAKVQMTLGSDPANVHQLNVMGAKGVLAHVKDAVGDSENKVFTTPCYMEPPDLAGMYEGVRSLVAKVTAAI